MLRRYTLQTIGQVNQGVTLSRLKDPQGESYRIIQVSNLNALEPDEDLETDRLSKYRTRLVMPGDVLISLRGAPIRAAVVPEHMTDCVVGTNIAIITPSLVIVHHNQTASVKSATVNPHYLAGLLNSGYMSRVFSRHMSGGPVPSLSVRALRDIEVPVPELEVQLNFADAFKALDRSVIHSRELLKLRTRRLDVELGAQLGEERG